MEDTNVPSTPGTGSGANFTDNETKLICAIMQNLTSEIQVCEAIIPPSKPKKQQIPIPIFCIHQERIPPCHLREANP
jgi:hypothetical protein